MSKDLSRRTVLTAPALLSLATGTATGTQPTGMPQSADSKSLVAHFSRSGNTRVIAGTLHRALGTDFFQIRPAQPYPESCDSREAFRRAGC
jgi:hypothetical protein